MGLPRSTSVTSGLPGASWKSRSAARTSGSYEIVPIRLNLLRLGRLSSHGYFVTGLAVA